MEVKERFRLEGNPDHPGVQGLLGFGANGVGVRMVQRNTVDLDQSCSSTPRLSLASLWISNKTVGETVQTYVLSSKLDSATLLSCCLWHLEILHPKYPDLHDSLRSKTKNRTVGSQLAMYIETLSSV